MDERSDGIASMDGNDTALQGAACKGRLHGDTVQSPTGCVTERVPV
jgi:hypothetical protein